MKESSTKSKARGREASGSRVIAMEEARCAAKPVTLWADGSVAARDVAVTN